MRIVVAPDSMGGLLDAPSLATAVGNAWVRARPDDEVVLVPMSDGGEGLLAVLRRPDDREVRVEVADPRGHPVDAMFLLRSDGSAVVETAAACGLHLVPTDQRNPLHTTTYGVGQLLQAARESGARRILVGLGGSATVDGGAGALTGLGFRLLVADGSGLKIGGADLHRVATVERGWVDPAWSDVEVLLLTDVTAALADAAPTFAPQKGATPDAVERLAHALEVWAEVAERDLAATGLHDVPGTGAAGGLGFGLAAALSARLVPGAAAVADERDLDGNLAAADLVITGEGRLDATSFDGKVVGEVAARAERAGVPVVVVAGRHDPSAPESGVAMVVEAPAATPQEATTRVAATVEDLARGWGR